MSLGASGCMHSPAHITTIHGHTPNCQPAYKLTGLRSSWHPTELKYMYTVCRKSWYARQVHLCMEVSGQAGAGSTWCRLCWGKGQCAWVDPVSWLSRNVTAREGHHPIMPGRHTIRYLFMAI